MAISKEYTLWHLTANGWVAGDSKTDFKSTSVSKPKDTVLTIKYSETINSDLYLVKDVERIFEIPDKAKIKELEAKFPFKGSIEVYE